MGCCFGGDDSDRERQQNYQSPVVPPAPPSVKPSPNKLENKPEKSAGSATSDWGHDNPMGNDASKDAENPEAASLHRTQVGRIKAIVGGKAREKDRLAAQGTKSLVQDYEFIMVSCSYSDRAVVFESEELIQRISPYCRGP